MNADSNKFLPCSFAPRTLLVFGVLVFMITSPVLAQERIVVEQARSEVVDANGRTTLEVSQRGAPVPVIEQVSLTVLEAQQECDGDEGCYEDNLNVADVIIPRELGDIVIPRDIALIEMLQVGGMSSFRVEEEAPKSSVHIDEVGNVGVGTDAPVGRIHVVSEAGAEQGRDIFVLDESGNVELGGVLTEASSRLLKENFTPVEVEQVLEALQSLAITTWSYKGDSERHMGPTAQDFYAAFGLGASAERLAPLDVNGVVLAAIQAYASRIESQSSEVTALEAEQAALLARLAALEALMRQRDE